MLGLFLDMCTYISDISVFWIRITKEVYEAVFDLAKLFVDLIALLAFYPSFNFDLSDAHVIVTYNFTLL